MADQELYPSHGYLMVDHGCRATSGLLETGREYDDPKPTPSQVLWYETSLRT